MANKNAGLVVKTYLDNKIVELTNDIREMFYNANFQSIEIVSRQFTNLDELEDSESNELIDMQLKIEDKLKDVEKKLIDLGWRYEW